MEKKRIPIEPFSQEEAKENVSRWRSFTYIYTYMYLYIEIDRWCVYTARPTKDIPRENVDICVCIYVGMEREKIGDDSLLHVCDE